VAAFAERVPEPSLTEYQAEVNRLRHAAHTINHLCANSVRTGIYTVACGAFKELLANSAEVLAKRLLDQVRATTRASNAWLSEEYGSMATEVDGWAGCTHPPSVLNAALKTTAADCECRLSQGIYTVACGAFKELLANSAEVLAKRLLDQVRATTRASNAWLSEEYGSMATEV
ncbi:uncharacterized protein HaLaN_05739, partial [Haematococcus lacustris]